ncbi:hypothetical protein G3N57_11350 [Paraburkholderia sp. Se-20369]|nr:hypothetical protein [Paraburkholderia sp. Se-20369]
MVEKKTRREVAKKHRAGRERERGGFLERRGESVGGRGVNCMKYRARDRKEV